MRTDFPPSSFPAAAFIALLGLSVGMSGCTEDPTQAAGWDLGVPLHDGGPGDTAAPDTLRPEDTGLPDTPVTPETCGPEQRTFTVRQSFEGSNPRWTKFYHKVQTQRPGDADDFQVTPDAENFSTSGNESARAAGPSYGTCGYGGIAKTFRFPAQPRELKLKIRARTDAWGRVNIILRDDSGFHVLWEQKAAGEGRVDIDRRPLRLDLSEFDRHFTLIVGNADQSTPWCHEVSDHGWRIWADDLALTVDCP